MTINIEANIAVICLLKQCNLRVSGIKVGTVNTLNYSESVRRNLILKATNNILYSNCSNACSSWGDFLIARPSFSVSFRRPIDSQSFSSFLSIAEKSAAPSCLRLKCSKIFP